MSEAPGTSVAGAAEAFVAPASYAQERVWFADRLAGHSLVYHVFDWFPLRFDLTAEQVLAALAEVVRRHESLRTGFRLDQGRLHQVVHPSVELPVTHADVSALAPAEREDELRRLYHAQADRRIDPDAAPLWRATLVRGGPAEWHLMFVAHHAVVDAASEAILLAELTELCAAAERGRPAELPELPVQCADHAVWQRDQLAGPRMAELLDFWRATLADLPVVHRLPTDRPRPAVRSFAGGDVAATLPPDVADALPAVCAATTSTPFMVLLSGYVALLRRLTGEDDTVVGIPVDGRDLPELRPLVGMFVNLLVLRVDAGGDPTFAELIGRVRAALLAALDHQDLPYQRLVEELGRHRVPPYQLGFNDVGARAFAGSSGGGTAEDDLMLEVGSDVLRVEYDSALFDEATAHGIAACYLDVLTTALADPGTRLSALPVEPLAGRVTAEVPAEDAPAPYVEPATSAELLVADVWAEVLGVERVGARDDFFALGGHSLLALRVIARLSAAAEVPLSIQEFFADTTVAGVAAALERALAAEIDAMSDEDARVRLDEGRAP
ncbi:MAG TPA: condensation domain-containing protein [Pseudonocardiaceae bacterium]